MTSQDRIEKIYFSNNDNFADIFNYYLFDGKKIINVDDLSDIDKELIIDDKSLTKRERDILKTATIKYDNLNNKTYIVLGIENQTNIDYKMIIRIMGYDYFNYYNQIQNIENGNKDGKIKVGRSFNKNNKLNPVITLVIYYGTRKWDSSKDLYSILKIENEELKRFIPNYFINIIEPYNMTDEDFNKLNYNNQAVFELIKYSNDKDKMYELISTKYHYINSIPARLINEVTKAELKIEESEGEIDMCKAIDDMRKESKAEGIAEGEARGLAAGIAEGEERGMAAGEAKALNQNIKTMYKNGMNVNDIVKYLGLDLVFVKKVLAE